MIPDGVTSIGESAFENCTSLTSITIGNGVTSIGNYAFERCNSLPSITIPDSVTSIGTSVFNGCTSLTSITIGNGVTSIGDDAFSNCSSLTSITIPDGVTSIGDRAFSDCSSLTSITIGNGVTSIGNYAFERCSNLTRIIFRGETPSIGSDLFFGVDEHTVIRALAFGAKRKDTQITQLEAQLAAMTAERDARFTEDQIIAMSADSIIGMNDAGKVEMKINFFESADLVTFAPFTVTPESVSVVDGNICLEFTPRHAAFFRFSLR
jgi:hypothetical protein